MSKNTYCSVVLCNAGIGSEMTRACVSGVWPEGSDGTDINALIRSHNRKVIALADDFCKVHLFAYPSSRAKVRYTLQPRSVFKDQPTSVCLCVCVHRLPVISTVPTAVM